MAPHILGLLKKKPNIDKIVSDVYNTQTIMRAPEIKGVYLRWIRYVDDYQKKHPDEPKIQAYIDAGKYFGRDFWPRTRANVKPAYKTP